MNNKIIGTIIMLVSLIGTLFIAVDKTSADITYFIDLTTLIFVLFVGGSFTFMRNHYIKQDELGTNLKDDLILAGWLGTLIGVILNFHNFSGDNQIFYSGFGYAFLPLLYGFVIGKIIECFLTN